MGQITETNQQYYQGVQGFRGTGNALTITTTFNTDLVYGSWNPAVAEYALNNFKIYTSTTGFPGSWTEYVLQYSVTGNAITFAANPANNLYIVVQLKTLDGGQYANTPAEEALGDAVEENYGSYQYIKLGDVIDNYMVGYVGDGKVIQTAKKSDVLFFAKRSLQEFSYDTLKSIKSQELTVPDSLSLTIPQDYVNYVKLSWVDGNGVKHTIYPTQLTSSPWEAPVQAADGEIVQDNFGDNIEGTPQINEKWQKANPSNITGLYPNDYTNPDLFMYDWWGEPGGPFAWYGQRYGGDPVNMQMNGWFNIDYKRGTFNFSSDLNQKLIILEYISDGLAYDLDTKVPKLAEEAMYQHLLYSIMSTRTATAAIAPQYKKQRYAALRNAKIRLSNIKLDEIVQVMRNKSKWIKH